MAKTIEDSFIDWESQTFGFGYGSGERHTLAALKAFFAEIGTDPDSPNYDFEKLEAAVTPTVAWLLINILCRHSVHMIEYGTSPRYGWLTQQGLALQAFLASKTVDELVDLCCNTDDPNYCYPNACNCGPRGYQEGVKCENPFWR